MVGPAKPARTAASPARTLWEAARTHIWLAFAFSAAMNLLYLAPSLYMLQVYDRVLLTGGLMTLTFLSLATFAALGALAMLDTLRARLLARISLRLERRLAAPVIRNAMGGSSAGARDLDQVRQGVTHPAAAALLDLPWTPLFIGACFVIHPSLGVLCIVGAVLILGVALANERAGRATNQTMAQAATQFYQAQDADARAAGAVRALGLQDALVRRRLAEREDLVGAQTSAAFTAARYTSVAKFVRMVLQSAALALGCVLAVDGQISPGAIIACSILTARAYQPIEQVVGGWRQMALSLIAFRAVLSSLGAQPASHVRTPLPAPRGEVRVESVTMLSPDGQRETLRQVSFTARPGEVVAIVGPSGAGKSTLARVLANAAIPVGGTVRLDGARYEDWPREVLAAGVGYLPQTIDLFAGTIAENIARFAGDRDVAQAEYGPKVVTAAQDAGAHEMILRLPHGYETRLGLNGAGLSPGQAQRVALARALYDCPRVLVLDEPNAHLDAEGEAALAAALRTAQARGAVVFVVAHRAGVISLADTLLVLREGRLEEWGPRDAVLRKLSPDAADARANTAPVSITRLPNQANVTSMPTRLQ